MKLSFHGACREVTGSCHLVETDQVRFLVDCGLFQGAQFAEEKNFNDFDFDPTKIDFLLLTHAHMDHCGRLPKLYAAGFRGPIYCTAPTRDLTEVMLGDSARVISEEAARHGHEPLYHAEDVIQVIKLFEIIEYRKEFAPHKDISVVARDAGHILGSCFFEIQVTDGGKTKKVVFSGDLGNPPAPIVGDTEFCGGADIVVMESTYGGRIHEPASMRLGMLQKAVIECIQRRGVLLIPAFSLERTQEVLYELNSLVENNQIPKLPIYVDSPLAIRAIEVYRRYEKMFDKESQQLIKSGDDLFKFPGLQYTKTVEESKTINNQRPPFVVMAGSGMCTGGRIVHHLKHHLGDFNSHILIISYQPEGSVGRQLLEHAKVVTIADEPVRVRASASAIGSYSSHADQPKLLHWVKGMVSPKPAQVFIVHGELKSNEMLADGLQQKLEVTSVVPEYGKQYEV